MIPKPPNLQQTQGNSGRPVRVGAQRSKPRSPLGARHVLEVESRHLRGSLASATALPLGSEVTVPPLSVRFVIGQELDELTNEQIRRSVHGDVLLAGHDGDLAVGQRCADSVGCRFEIRRAVTTE